ncbi:TPA: hypothetical protein ACQTZV_000363 [Pseudomonas aeruginosa]|uniref:hypothetical protein n=1 Tax=Pseudomonas aeruginosa TaxID=287 RepID=UPI0012FD8793|nr:hypothetical protein [Pseudomonas aeruginosa]
MQNSQDRVAVIGKNFSSLLEFSRKLNDLEIFHVTLRETSTEIVELLQEGEKFDTLIFDDFEIQRDRGCLHSIASCGSVNLIILTADVNFQERQNILQWASSGTMPPLRVLPLSIRFDDLKNVI